MSTRSPYSSIFGRWPNSLVSSMARSGIPSAAPRASRSASLGEARSSQKNSSRSCSARIASRSTLSRTFIPAPPKLASAPDKESLGGLDQRRLGLGRAGGGAGGAHLGRSLGAIGDQQPRQQGA